MKYNARWNILGQQLPFLNRSVRFLIADALQTRCLPCEILSPYFLQTALEYSPNPGGVWGPIEAKRRPIQVKAGFVIS